MTDKQVNTVPLEEKEAWETPTLNKSDIALDTKTSIGNGLYDGVKVS